MKQINLIIPGNNDYKKKVENSCFLFPLNDYSVGITKTFNITEIPEYSYIYINRILDTSSIASLKELLKNNSNKVKGIVFEDLGIINIIDELNLKIEKILYATHALTSTLTIKTYLNFVDTCIISPDVTKEETESIINELKDKVGILLFGRLPLMYSRRSLLTNYNEEKGLPLDNNKVIEEKLTGYKFLFTENEYGTVIYDYLKYDARELLNNNYKYNIINLDTEACDIEDWLTNYFNNIKLEGTTNGFLDRKTIYKLPSKEASK